MTRWEQMNKAYEHMADEQSRRWFEARLEYAVTRQPESLCKCIQDDAPEFAGWDLASIQAMMEQERKKKILIFGAGRDGKHIAYVLEHSSLAGCVQGFLESNPQRIGMSYAGLPIFSAHDAEQYADDSIILIGSRAYGLEMYHQLARSNFPQSSIYLSPFGIFTAGYGHQYFDVFAPKEHEVFVDAGCFDAATSIEFVAWCRGNYDRIYAMEASPELAEACKKTLERHGIQNYELIPKACWKETADVHFQNDMLAQRTASAHVSAQGEIVHATSIDDFLGGDRATFVKMDIEGAEYEALQGAEKTIRNCHPRLAISVYHKPSDILDIPSYLMTLDETYRFYIRHYSSWRWETVLYAE